MKQILIFSILLLFAEQVFAQDPVGIRKKHLNLENGVAISGFDPVAYFLQKKAVRGNKKLAVTHQGVVYYFSAEANKTIFLKDPAGYEPEFGGWCAYAMGNSGEKISIDPETFKVLNGRRCLFYNRFFTNTLTGWNKNETALKNRADINWAKIYRLFQVREPVRLTFLNILSAFFALI